MTNHALSVLTQQLSRDYKNACLAEIEALKPGNVHIFSDGHGMKVQDFVSSAEASSATIAQANLNLGERIYRSIEATWDAVGCNTNLGIVLLCAPIIQASFLTNTENLRQRLKQVLANTTQIDAEWAFKAIQLANPAGLGHADVHDVHTSAKGSLLEAMEASAERDLIGRQYSNCFLQVFEEGLPQYQQALSTWERPAWAATALYLYWLSHYPDSHIARKYDLKVAQRVQQEALIHYQAFQSQTHPNHYLSNLLAFDESLKTRNINPGTSADLTVATLFLQDCVKMELV